MTSPQPEPPNLDDGHGVLLADPRVSSSASDDRPWWDPRLPVLAGLLARMEDMACPSVYLTETGSIFYTDFQQTRLPDGRIRGVTAGTRPPGPVTAAELLNEQISARAEQFVLALANDRDRFRIRHYTSIPDYLGWKEPDPAPVEPRLVQMPVTVQWLHGPAVRLSMPPIPRPTGRGTRRP